MEAVENNQKVGAGIITMSVLYLLGQVFTIFGLIINLVAKDEISSILAESGVGVQVTTMQIVIALAISLIITLAVILILFKKPIGAYIFIGIEILSFIYSIISGGFTVFSLVALIFPGLMIFFLYKKKEIYFSNLKL
ncbi:hypothetical protein [Clostridium tertium]|uniref:DUF4064 domain-containing protein n=1 Tax=Clostridium tertium TaxID=1559 RepID=A0A6N3A9E4_9CLOT